LEALQKQTPHQLRKFFYAHNCRGESTMLERLELVQQAQALTLIFVHISQKNRGF
jgi:hypothetical protein